MPLTRPIPAAAIAVREVLRRDVPRPSALPELTPVAPLYDEDERYVLRWKRERFGNDVLACPMGLHPGSRDSAPSSGQGFLGFCVVPGGAVWDFGVWFDAQDDAAAAVEAIWGPSSSSAGGNV